MMLTVAGVGIVLLYYPTTTGMDQFSSMFSCHNLLHLVWDPRSMGYTNISKVQVI